MTEEIIKDHLDDLDRSDVENRSCEDRFVRGTFLLGNLSWLDVEEFNIKQERWLLWGNTDEEDEDEEEEEEE